jgi:hypothetical protein
LYAPRYTLMDRTVYVKSAFPALSQNMTDFGDFGTDRLEGVL